MNTILIVIIALLPALAWFFLWRFQDKEKEPFRSMLGCFLLGILASFPFFVWQQYWPNTFSGFHPSLVIFLLAFAEEMVKAIALIIGIELSQRWFTQIVDGLIYGSAVALGFAFAENISYLLEFATFDGEFVMLYLVRSLNTMVAHSLFTALFGFFYASAYLRKAVFTKKKREKPWLHFFKNVGEALPLHVTLVHLLPNRPSKHGHYPGSLILEGIIVAGGLHGLFNLLLSQEVLGLQLGFLTYPLLFGLAYLVWRMFLQGVYVRIIHLFKS